MNETISVIFVTQPQNTERSEFLKSHRRLFSALNRNAKPTDVATNIIMDEDDRFAIATRRMISAHESFQWISTSEKPPKVDLQLTTESMPTSNKSLTNIISFYKWNIELLWDEDFSREHGTSTGSGFKKLIQSTPTDEEIDDLTDYLGRIWDALHRILPDLDNDGSKMRASNPNEQEREEGYRSNLLFRPICQGPMVGRLARRLMTEKGINNSSSEDDIMKSLNPLSKIPLDLHHGLYKYLLITDFENPEIFKMRSESRSLCVKKAYEILLWLVGLEELGEADIDKLQADWGGLLLEAQSPQYESDVWEELISLRTEIVS